MCENDAKKPAQRVTWAKCDLDNFRGHLRYDLSAMSITSQHGGGAELKKIEVPLFFLNSCFKLDHFIFFSAVDLKSLKKDKVAPKVGSTSTSKAPITTTENPPPEQEDDSPKKKKVILHSLLSYYRNYFLN